MPDDGAAGAVRVGPPPSAGPSSRKPSPPQADRPAPAPASASESAPAPAAAPARRLVMNRALALLVRAAVVLAVGAVVWFVALALWQIALLVGALLAALLLTALLEPAAALLRRIGLPPSLAAAITTLALLGGLAGVGVVIYSRATTQLDGVGSLLTFAIDDLRQWLITGPLQLDPSRVQDLRDLVVDQVQRLAPAPMASARTALRLLSGAILAVFAVFFLLKDGRDMWRWLLGWTPSHLQDRVNIGGTAAWKTLGGYVRGVVVVATIDAVGIGAALFVLDVPVWVSLTVLTFLGAFVPLLGATVAGAVAVLVTLVTNSVQDAVIVLVVVLVVQQIEGNVLQPLIMGRAVHLHPLAVLAAVTAGVLVIGVVGALVAVPLTAVVYQVVAALRERPGLEPDLDTGVTDRS